MQARQSHPENIELAAALLELADLLERQRADEFRVRAYRNAAETVRSLNRPVSAILQENGIGGLEQLRGVGRSLAQVIKQWVRLGRIGLVDHLRSGIALERALATVPGIGCRLAKRIRSELAITNLTDLEAAAWDGRLSRVQGMGQRRVQAIREALAGRFSRAGPPGSLGSCHTSVAPLSELLDIDAEYRHLAAANRLPGIAPQRFNPSGAGWLPVLYTHRGDRHYTAMFSNSTRAHRVGAGHDWVMIYRDDHVGDEQWTVVTARRGALRGKRVVSGHEQECCKHYERQQNLLFPLLPANMLGAKLI